MEAPNPNPIEQDKWQALPSRGPARPDQSDEHLGIDDFSPEDVHSLQAAVGHTMDKYFECNRAILQAYLERDDVDAYIATWARCIEEAMLDTASVAENERKPYTGRGQVAYRIRAVPLSGRYCHSSGAMQTFPLGPHFEC